MRVGAGYSIFGPTIEAQTKLGRNVTVKGSYSSGIGLPGSYSTDGLTYTLSGKAAGMSAVASYHLPAGVRVSGGLFMSNSSVKGSVSGTLEDFQTGGGAAPVSVESSVSFARTTAPLTTIGVDIPLFSGFVMSTDAGVIWNGGYNVNLTETTSGGDIIPAGDLSSAEAEIEAELSNFNFFPYVSLVVGKWF